jgi:hypothetical protein
VANGKKLKKKSFNYFVWTPLAGVVDTSSKFATCVVDTTGKLATITVDTSGAP